MLHYVTIRLSYYIDNHKQGVVFSVGILQEFHVPYSLSLLSERHSSLYLHLLHALSSKSFLIENLAL